MPAPAVKTSQALLTALAALTAFESGQYDEAAAMAGEPAAFFGVLALASRLKMEIRVLNGDPEALLDAVYDKASGVSLT